MSDLFSWLYLAGLVVGAVPAVAFPVLYTIRARWWRSEMGRHLFSFSLLFALLYVNGLVRLLIGTPPEIQKWINLVLVVGAAIVAWQRTLVFRHAQHQRNGDTAATQRWTFGKDSTDI